MLTIADEVGGWVHEPLILADVICEQPLNSKFKFVQDVIFLQMLLLGGPEER